MPGDFEERLAAVDDALDDETASTAGGAEAPASGAGSSDVDARTGPSATAAGGGEWSSDGSGDGSAGSMDVAPADVAAADVAALAERVAELEAAVQALRGYAGSVRAVNDRVEERVDAAVATTDDLRERVGALERGAGGGAVASAARKRGAATSSSRGGENCRCRDWDRDSGDGRTGVDSGPVDAGRASDAGCKDDAGRRGDSAGSGPGAVAWPPEAPRAPYEDPDADDDREQPGLVARLRDAL